MPVSGALSINDSDILAPASKVDSSCAVSVAVKTPGRISYSFIGALYVKRRSS